MELKYEVRINKSVFSKDELNNLFETIISDKSLESEMINGRLYLIGTAEKMLEIKEKLHRFGDEVEFVLKGLV